MGKAWDTLADNGGVITANCLQAFNYFGQRNREKHFTQMRPVFNTNGTPSVSTKMNLDFDTSDPTAAAAYSTTGAAIWNTSLWDNSVWAGDVGIQAVWQGAIGVGRTGAPHVVASAYGINLQWLSTDVIWKPGGIFG